MYNHPPEHEQPEHKAMKQVLIAVLTAALMIGTAQAEQRPLEVSSIVSQQQEIRAGLMARSGRYKNMTETKRDELLSKQERLLAMLDGKQTSADLTDDEKIEAFNMLEWIEAAINNAEDERMICKRERTIGSQRVTQTCRTQAQMRADRERARDEMMDSSNRIQTRR
jgi:hypothetical protein